MQRQMSAFQWFELLCGTAAGACGLLGLGYALFAPLGRYTTGTSSCSSNGVCTTQTTSGTASLAQMGMSSDAWFNVSILCVCLLVVMVSAILHSTLRQKAWLVTLWCAAGIVLLFTFLAILTIGLFLAPAALLALVAAILGTRVQAARAAWG